MRVRRPGPGGSVLTAALRRGSGPRLGVGAAAPGAGPGRRPKMLGSGHRGKGRDLRQDRDPELRRTRSGPLRALRV